MEACGSKRTKCNDLRFYLELNLFPLQESASRSMRLQVLPKFKLTNMDNEMF